MANLIADLKSIFGKALELPTSQERSAYLDQACQGDTRLRAEVESLLRVHPNAGDFFGEQSPAALATVDIPRDESVGTQIGPYKIRELLGEGGMGRVYAAAQEKPLRRKVALKIIRPGMDTRQVIARFDAERQALALMDHSFIAKVLDAGATDDGRPYFVMELVRGVPITEFCDSRNLSTRQRLELFVQVCQAVQHAHQKGIIHRDIKPSNVLVTLHDDLAVPKVIDFGVAKATSHLLTDHSIYTGVAQLIGTPLYMSPEQAEMNAPDVDTRSDVYSLGVLLYELITGATPFDNETFKHAGFDEMRRLIREIDPPRPSERVSTLAAAARTTVSNRRGVHEDVLYRTLRSELDWIVMKSLEKDRTRRYESASAFAADVQRYLSDEPVQACPPSAAYRLRKFLRRRRQAVSFAAVVACAVIVVAGVATSAWYSSWRADEARAGRIRESLLAANTSIDAGNLDQAEVRLGHAKALLAEGAPIAQLALQVVKIDADIGARRKDHRDVELFRSLVEEGLQDGMGATDVGDTHGSATKALELFGVFKNDQWQADLQRRSYTPAEQKEIQETAYIALLFLADHEVRWKADPQLAARGQEFLNRAASFHEPTRAFHFVQAQIHRILGNKVAADAADARFRETPAISAWDYFLPGHSAGWGGDLPEAIRSYEAALRIQPDHYQSLYFLGMRLDKAGRHAEAIRQYAACMALRPNETGPLLSRGTSYSRLGDNEAAEADYTRAIELATTDDQRYHKASADTYGARGSFYLAQGQLTKALADFDKALEIVRLNNFSDTATAVNVYDHRAELFYRMGQNDKALDELNAAIAITPEERGKPVYVHVFRNRAMMLEERGEYVKALADVEEALQIAAASKMSDSSVAFAHLTRGKIFHHTQRKAEAIEDFDKALDLASKQNEEFIRETRCIRARALFDLNRPQEGVSELSKVIVMVPKEPTTYWVWAHNELSWNLATCSNAAVRDLPRAIALASKAVELESKNGEFRNTLGVAQYRSGDLTAAITSLNKSLELGVGGTGVPYSAIFLAMAHRQLDHQDQAIQWYDKAVKWMTENKSNDEELLRLRAEAELILGIEPEAQSP